MLNLMKYLSNKIEITRKLGMIINVKTKKGLKQVSDPTSTYEKHTPERVSPNVTNFIIKKKV